MRAPASNLEQLSPSPHLSLPEGGTWRRQITPEHHPTCLLQHTADSPEAHSRPLPPLAQFSPTWIECTAGEHPREMAKALRQQRA